jgi:hypothetical protein
MTIIIISNQILSVSSDETGKRLEALLQNEAPEAISHSQKQALLNRFCNYHARKAEQCSNQRQMRPKNFEGNRFSACIQFERYFPTQQRSYNNDFSF